MQLLHKSKVGKSVRKKQKNNYVEIQTCHIPNSYYLFSHTIYTAITRRLNSEQTIAVATATFRDSEVSSPAG